MLLTFDKTLTINLSSNTPYLNGYLNVPSVSAVDIARIVDRVNLSQVYVRVGIKVAADSSQGDIDPFGAIRLDSLSNIVDGDNKYNNPQWTYDTIAAAVRTLFLNADSNGSYIFEERI